MEKVYADHSNRLKDLANKARKEAVNTKSIPYAPSAKKAYEGEVSSLNAKLNVALKNRPLERQALILANTWVAAKTKSNPGMDNAEIKKLRAQAMTEARLRTGAKKTQIHITPTEWQAIQAGAISNHKLTEILDNADMDVVKQLATPKPRTLMTSVKTSRARTMLKSGYTQSEVADALGVSVSTLKLSLSEGG
jgi:DNA-binding transcriptional regulator YiaG